METIKKSRLLYTLAFVLIAGLMCCCSDDRDHYGVSGGNEKMVTFSVKVPGSGTPRTYALDEDNENEVKSIAILLFDNAGKYTYQPVYCNKIDPDPSAPSDNQKKTFSVKIPEGTYSSLIILANANQVAGNAINSISQGELKASVISKLVLTNGKWNASPGSSGYIDIPMWGEIGAITIGSSTPANNPVSLVRMVSKIDVALTSTTAKSAFNLQSVRLYNYNDRGQVAPDADKWNAGDGKVTAPTVPSSAQKPSDPANNPYVYDGAAITTDGTPTNARGISCTGEIYTFEAAAGSGSTLQANTCLVIGGYYGSDSQLTYYRVDFANTTVGTTTYLALLRNHHYKVNISDVSGPGLPDPKDAFEAPPVNIKASIVQWSDGRFTAFAVNDQYLIGVSQSEFSFSREERTASSTDNTLSVITDYSGGWKVSKIVDEGGNDVNSTTNPTTGWLSCSPASGSNPAGNDIKLLLKENTGTSGRTAFIHLTADADRLTYIVKVNQGIKTEIGIFLTGTDGKEISMLEFAAAKSVQPDMQQFKLSWTPASSDVFITVSAIVNPFSFGSGSDAISSGSLDYASGARTYSIRPSALDSELNSAPFYERTSVVLYSVSDGMSTVSKTLTLRQFAYNMVPVYDNVYLMDGTRKSFGVRSNTPFTVEIKTNPSNVISNLTTSGVANTGASGTPVYFDIIDDLTNPVLYQKEVTVTIKSPTGLFPDTDVTLNCASGILQDESNSYIAVPGGVGILIPVSRANIPALGTQIGSSDAFTAELVWTDNSNRIAANSNIKMIRAVGTGDTGYILVMPGSAEGNAVVAVKNSSNKILWSWHIWVTGYNPNTSTYASNGQTFMERNLGALNNTKGDVGSKGLLYQWGRKDPFPGSTTTTGTTEPTLYTESGSFQLGSSNKVVAPTGSSPNYNIGLAVANPTIFYYGTSTNNYDWYSNTSGIKNDNLWGPSSKSVYDPCPKGWRVPTSGATTASPWNGLAGQSFTAGQGIDWTSSSRGYYPAAGYRNYNSGSFNSVGTNGYYWSASTTGAYGYNLFFSNTGGISTSNNTSRALGFSVRCVQE